MNGCSPIWLTADEYAALASISPQAARKRLRKAAKVPSPPEVRLVPGRGGKSGLRYEVLLSSLPERFRQALSGASETAETSFHAPIVSAPRFIAAPNQADVIDRRFAVLRLVMQTERGTTERAQAIRDSSHHHVVPVRTIQRWVKQCEDHGWSLDALARRCPADAGRKRVLVSREFDKRFHAAGYAASELESLAAWLDRQLAGLWQSPVQRAGWHRVRRDTLTALEIECRRRGFELPRQAYYISRRRVEDLSHHRIVDVMENDAKRFDDMKPRIRRDWTGHAPMQTIVMDVKPIDCALRRPDGSIAYPKLLGFFDAGTQRMFGRIVLLPKGEGVRQEHITSAFLEMVGNREWGFPSQLYLDNGSEYKHFDLIRHALALVAREGVNTVIHAKPYSGASKPIEGRFAEIDRQIFSLMHGWTGSNRMDKKVQRVGKEAKPYPGSAEAFEQEFLIRLADLEAQPFRSGSFVGRSPAQIFADHVASGWRPVTVDPMALDFAFAKQIERRVDRGTVSIDGMRFRHPELASFSGRTIRIARPFRRGSQPMASLPGIGWAALETEMAYLPHEIEGAIEASRSQQMHRKTVKRSRINAGELKDPFELVRDRVAQLPTSAAPAPLIDVMLSSEAENYAAARRDGENKIASLPTRAERARAAEEEMTRLLEQKYGH